MDALTNGFTIRRIDGTYLYHSLTDFGLAVSNTDYIGEPTLETFTVDVPGRKGIVDMSEDLTGYPVFKTREIKLHVGGLNPKNDWDSVISTWRNYYHGRKCRIVFDNDPQWFWEGRVYINNFTRKQSLGEFDLKMTAFAYKKKLTAVHDSYTSPATITIRNFDIPISPRFRFDDNPNYPGPGTVEYDGVTYQYNANEIFRIPGLYTENSQTISLTYGELHVTYEELSL